ncbi:MAG TPA: peptidoglycan DD-metalloendopeptidase family protein [Candidatus Lokiarchaeia archaeon]|nr:peptidoglycan DD-metalloendopeptidase family protein [Candidatus Lokiarchaeia archaeon]
MSDENEKKPEDNRKKRSMTKKAKIAIAVAIIIVVTSGITFIAVYSQFNDIFFNNGGRYDSSVLNDMGVIYTNRTDIHAFREGYSTSAACPWGFAHNGIDYFFTNSSSYIAAAPGNVISVQVNDFGSSQANRYRVAINIRFSATLVLLYNLEPWTNSTTKRDYVVSQIQVKVGDWVVKGQSLGTFVGYSDGSHVHFGVLVNNNAVCPQPYFGVPDLAELMAMIHSYNSSWNLCYT